MPDPKLSKAPGGAKIERTGHTTNDRYGSGTNMTVKGNRTPRDLKVK